MDQQRFRSGTLPLAAYEESTCHFATPAEALTHYVVVRADLPRGIQAANIIHAAGESSPGDIAEGTHAICLTVPDEPALRALVGRLLDKGVEFTLIVEPDAPYNGAAMAIGLRPRPREELRRHVSTLPLLR